MKIRIEKRKPKHPGNHKPHKKEALDNEVVFGKVKIKTDFLTNFHPLF